MGASNAKAGQAPTVAASPTPQGLAVWGDILWQSSSRVGWGAGMMGMGDPALALSLAKESTSLKGQAAGWGSGEVAE